MKKVSMISMKKENFINLVMFMNKEKKIKQNL